MYIEVAAGGELGEGKIIYAYPKRPPSVANGKRVFERNCAACHGFDGDGWGAEVRKRRIHLHDFTDRHWAVGETDADWFGVVSFGLPNTPMRGWHDRLTEQERWDVIAYVRQFAYKRDEPSSPPAGKAGP
jgi:mono/diheme cytochrome c family protein